MNSDKTVMLGDETASPFLRDDNVRVQAIYSAIISSQMNYCSVAGRVIEAGQRVEGLTIGDIVVALAPPTRLIALTADSCQKLTDTSVVTEKMAFWALALALIPAIRLSEFEIGERVLVLSNSLLGQMLADLTWLAGAVACLGVDPDCTSFAQHDNPSEPSRGPHWVEDLTRETTVPGAPVDLLIDASGDSVQLQSNLTRVHDLGRVLTIGHCLPQQLDFNVYSDLHKRSLKLFNYQLPISLRDLRADRCRILPPMNQMVEFVRYLFESERLPLLSWSMTRLRAPGIDTLTQALQVTKRRTLLIQW